MYLFVRLAKSDELASVDFTVNQNWFFIKLLSDGSLGNREKEMHNKSYSDAIGEVLSSLHILSGDLCHIGRKLGPALAEFAQVPREEIMAGGNWSPGILEKYYSQKLPIGFLRSMAGFHKEPGYHFNARTDVIPPSELVNEVFPFVDPAFEKVKAAMDEAKEKRKLGTAYRFLKFVRSLRVVFLQDVAAMMALHGKRVHRNHLYHAGKELFDSKLFKVCVCFLFSLFLKLLH